MKVLDEIVSSKMDQEHRMYIFSGELNEHVKESSDI